MIPTKEKKFPINVSKRSTGHNIKPEKPHVDKVNDVRLDPISFFQRQLGNRDIQAKLKVSQPNDKYEQEADCIADLVMQMPEPEVQRQPEEEEEEELIQSKPLAEQITPLVQRQIGEEKERAAYANQMTGEDQKKDFTLQSRIYSINQAGTILSNADRTFYEPRFRSNFKEVRIHIDTMSDNLTRAFQARALTFGNNIFFRKGEYDPNSKFGKLLLAHELVHVLQQRDAPMQEIQRWTEKHPTKWAGGSTTTTDDDSYVEIKSTVWGKKISDQKWNTIDYPENSLFEFPIPPFGEWSEIGTYLEIHDHRDTSPDVDEYWTVWVYWPIESKGNIIGTGGKDIKGPGRYAVLTVKPILDTSTRRLGTEFTMESRFTRTDEVSLFGTIGGSQSVSGGAFTRTWWIQYNLPEVAKSAHKGHYSKSVFFDKDSPMIKGEHITSLYSWLSSEIPSSAWEQIKKGSIEIKVEALASTTGTVEHNQRLSRKRRDNVIKLLHDLIGSKANLNPSALGELKARKKGEPDEKENPRWRSAIVEFDF